MFKKNQRIDFRSDFDKQKARFDMMFRVDAATSRSS
jgi:hypothetical protein